MNKISSLAVRSNCLTIKISNQYLQELFVDSKLPPHRMMKKTRLVTCSISNAEMLVLSLWGKNNHKNLQACEKHEIRKHPWTTCMLGCFQLSGEKRNNKKNGHPTSRPKPLSLDTFFLPSKNGTKSQVVKR